MENHPPVTESSTQKVDGGGKKRKRDIVIEKIYSLVASGESMVKAPVTKVGEDLRVKLNWMIMTLQLVKELITLSVR